MRGCGDRGEVEASGQIQEHHSTRGWSTRLDSSGIIARPRICRPCVAGLYAFIAAIAVWQAPVASRRASSRLYSSIDVLGAIACMGFLPALEASVLLHRPSNHERGECHSGRSIFELGSRPLQARLFAASGDVGFSGSCGGGSGVVGI